MKIIVLQSTRGKSRPEHCNWYPAWSHLWAGQGNLISVRPQTLPLLFMAFWPVLPHQSISIKETVSHHYGGSWQERWCWSDWHHLSLLCNIWGHLPIIFIFLGKKISQQFTFQPILEAFPYPGCILGMNWINSINVKKGSLMSNRWLLVPDVSCSVSE